MPTERGRAPTVVAATHRRLLLAIGVCYLAYFAAILFCDFWRGEELGIRLRYAGREVARGFSSYLIDAQMPAALIDWTRESVGNKYIFLLGLNVFLLIVGCVMDIFSALFVVVPLIAPVGAEFASTRCISGSSSSRTSSSATLRLRSV